jgi:hypothetical protein
LLCLSYPFHSTQPLEEIFMGSRNFDLGARDMKAAGRIALERGMCRSPASTPWPIAGIVRRLCPRALRDRPHGAISLDVVMAYGEILADQVDEELLKNRRPRITSAP